MRNPGDWKKVVAALFPAGYWIFMAITREDANPKYIYWALAAPFAAFAIYYAVRPPVKPPAPPPI
jgi:hypothetical protein